ncbi:MAG: UDP-N-acetylglucosamine 4,6-dehydratase (inverting) [Candidatus Binataceae bacterium]
MTAIKVRAASPASAWTYFNGRSLLITGATGSFGREFVRSLLLKASPRRLVVFSRDEMKQLEMSQKLTPLDRMGCLRFFIGDVRDRRRLVMALRDIEFVVHAAALKQVPVAEYNPFECIHTNVLGAENVVQACIETGVERLIALSTDKAANPINLYGASKLAADKIFIAANHLRGKGGTKFSVVRYGNVLGSRGSVIPMIRDRLAQGAKDFPVTDPRMTRFWITLNQGANFVASCMGMLRGGEIYVPKIPSMKIVDLIRAMAPELKHKIVGVRPGEKLHEVMISADDARTTRDLGDRYVISPSILLGNGKTRKLAGKPVPEGFCYASNTNDQWLNPEELLGLICDETA